MIIAHKIELVPNNKQKTHFKQAFGCSRLAYNWGLAKWIEHYKEQGKSISHLELKKKFNSIKETEFPFVYNVSKWAVQQPFFQLNEAIKRFFDKKGGYPKFKKKKEGHGSYYICGDSVNIKRKENSSKSYLQVPRLGLVKMREQLRFEGKIQNVVISQYGEKFFASFCIEITQEEYERTHKRAANTQEAIGIDMGIKSFLSLSNGLDIIGPKPLDKGMKKLKRLSKRLSKKIRAKKKEEALKKEKVQEKDKKTLHKLNQQASSDGNIGTNEIKNKIASELKAKTKHIVQKEELKYSNYKKQQRKLLRAHRRIANIRKDYIQKLTTILVRNFSTFGVENLNVKGMVKNHRLARAINDMSFYEFIRQLEYKCEAYSRKLIKADRFFPSSKTCSHCGNIKKTLTLKERVYNCDKCGASIDRDRNASINLLKFAIGQISKIGSVGAKFKPVDLRSLQSCLNKNKIVFCKE